MTPHSRWRFIPHANVLILLGAVIVFAFASIPERHPSVSLIIDLDLKHKSTVEAFWNNFQEAPHRAIHPGTGPTIINLSLPNIRIYQLRVDPTERAEEDVVVHRIAIRLPDGSEREIPLDSILKWSFANTTTPVLANGALTFHSTTGDPYFYGPVDFSGGTWFDQLANSVYSYVRSNDFIIHLLLIGSLAAFMLAASPWQSLAVAVALPLFLAVLRFWPALLLGLFGPDHFDVSQAVGRGIFVGSSIEPQRWTTIGLGVCAVILGLILGRMQFQSVASVTSDENDAQSRKASFARETFLAALFAAIVVGILLPDLNVIAKQKLNGTFSGQWDANLINTWAGFVAQGKRPYLDFWYPYSGMWTFDLPLPWGSLFRLLHSVVLFSTLAVALWRLLGGRARAWVAIVACIFILCETNILPIFERYLISVTVVLSYVAIDRSSSPSRSGRPWFWISCISALWIEPPQLFYAAPGVIIALIGDEIRRREYQVSKIAVRAICDFLIPIICLCGFVLVLVWNGEFYGFIETNIQNALSANFALLPTSLEFEISHFYSADVIGAFAPYLLLLVAAILIPASRVTENHKLALAVVCTASVGIMTLQKHLIRNIDYQLLLPTVIGALLLLALLWRYPRGRAATAVLIGAVAAGAILNPQISKWPHRVLLGMPARIASDYEILAHQRSLLSEANRAAFAEARFSEFDEELAVSRRLRDLGKRSIFVFGDTPILYLLSSGPTPFQVNNYNASPVRAQWETRDWLERVRPDAVVMDPTFFVFDEISVTVRDPLIVEEVVKNYVPAEPVGRFYLLFPRTADQKIPLAQWRNFLGARIDYGYILRNIERTASPQCSPDASHDCLRYLKLTFGAAHAGLFVFSIDVDGLIFQVSFMRSAGVKTYLVPIDRMWFWHAAEANGLTPHPQITEAGVYVSTIVAKAQKNYNLY